MQKIIQLWKQKAHRFQQTKQLADCMIWDMKFSDEASIFIIRSRNLSIPTRHNFFTIQWKDICLISFSSLCYFIGPDYCIEALTIYQLQVANPYKS